MQSIKWLAIRKRVGRCCFTVSFLVLAASGALADTLIIQGSTTFQSELVSGHLPAIEAAINQNLRIIANKSNLGLIALLTGEADLAMISTTLVNEAEVLRRSSPSLPIDRLHEMVIGRTRAAIVVHPNNPVRTLTVDELQRILVGDIENWRAVGGPDLPIRVVAVREGGGTLGSVEAAVLGVGKHIGVAGAIRVQNGPQVVKVVAQEIGALGISQDKLVDAHAVKRLHLSAPIEQQLSLVSLGAPTEAMQRVVDAFRDVAHGVGLD